MRSLTLLMAGIALVFPYASAAAPIVSVPDDITVEGDGPGGTEVTFTASAENPRGKPLPVRCDPGGNGPSPLTSTVLFALGTTTVTCRVGEGDAEGPGPLTFVVRVLDTTPPALAVPDPLTVAADSEAGTPSTNAQISSFLSGAVAADIVDRSPQLSHDAPSFFPVGTTVVRFTARDSAGNTTTRSSTVTVTVGRPPPQDPGDTTPPGDVSRLVVRATWNAVRLTWRRPSDPDFRRVTVTRSRGNAQARVVYRGAGTRFVDRRVTSGMRHRYVITSHDQTGNRSAGVAKTIVVPWLRSPGDGARVQRPPTLRWSPVPRATYYNVQLWRNGKKVLSRWPSGERLRVNATWHYDDRRFRFSSGRYTWYVWPGYGARADARYGELLGQHRFVK